VVVLAAVLVACGGMVLEESIMAEFTRYRRKAVGELRPYVEGESVDGISINIEDLKAGSPKAGDMIARNPENPLDQWLVNAAYFAANYEPV
jgi:hypothetical protein